MTIEWVDAVGLILGSHLCEQVVWRDVEVRTIGLIL